MKDIPEHLRDLFEQLVESSRKDPVLSHKFFNSRDFRDWARTVGYTRATSVFLGLKRADLKPVEIIDVGVQGGTPWLYKVFPDAKYVLVDPLNEAESRLQFKPKTYEFMQVAVGGSVGEMVFHEHGGASSLLERSELTKGDLVAQYKVKVETLDNIIDRHCTSSSIGIKLDVEGYELEAVKGLNTNIGNVEFIIAECSVLKRFKESYNFSELVAALLEKGFVFYNILNPSGISAPLCYDCLFLHEGDKRFSERSWLRPGLGKPRQ